jgi:hypothetical protein
VKARGARRRAGATARVLRRRAASHRWRGGHRAIVLFPSTRLDCIVGFRLLSEVAVKVASLSGR